MLIVLFVGRAILEHLHFVLRFITLSRGWRGQMQLARGLSSDGHLHLVADLQERRVFLERLL